MITQITAADLQTLMASGSPITLIDVRELEEHAQFNIGGLLAPLSELNDHLEKFNSPYPVIVYCKKGIRSVIAIQRLLTKNSALNLINLQGGVEAWKNIL